MIIYNLFSMSFLLVMSLASRLGAERQNLPQTPKVSFASHWCIRPGDALVQINATAEDALKQASIVLSKANSLSAVETIERISTKQLEEIGDDGHHIPVDPTVSLYTRTVIKQILAKPNLRWQEYQTSSPSKPSVPKRKRIGSDGKIVWLYSPDSKEYSTWPLKHQELERTIEARMNGELRPLNGFYFSSALIASDIKMLKEQGRIRHLEFAGDEIWEGKRYRLVKLEYTDDYEWLKKDGIKVEDTPTYTYIFYIGKDKIIYRSKLSHPIIGKSDVQIRRLQLDPRSIDPKQFSFVVPKGAKPFPEHPETNP